jgi:hypothetical protein
VLLDKPPEKPPSASSTGVDVAGVVAFLHLKTKAGLIGLSFHFRETITTIMIIFDWSDWGTKKTMQKIRRRMPAAQACSSGGSSREFELQNGVAYGSRSSVEINPTFLSPIRTSHSERKGPKAF